MAQLGAGGGDELDMCNAGRTQRLRCSTKRGTGGHDVVDDEHSEACARLPSAERRARQAIGSRLTCLGTAVSPIQQSTAGNAELTSDGAGNGLGLVIAASAYATSAGGRPSDDIDVLESQSTNHLCRKHPRCRLAVAELQRHDQLPRHPLEGKRGAYACRATQWAGRCQRESAAMAQVVARVSARGASSRKQPRKQPRKQHGAINTRRV